MGAEPGGSLAAFKQLLEQAKASPEAEAPVTFTEALAGAEHAPVLRACAIPHEFNRDVLQILGVWRCADEANRCYDAFSELSIVQSGAKGLSIHERWRKPLWTWWLREENRAEFQRISRRLTEYFSGTPEGGAAEVYHLIGADAPAGLTKFEALCRRARHQWRFNECSALIRLVHDYDPILAPGQRAVVGYHEGKLAADLCDWKRAEDLFRAVADNPSIPTALRVKALVRLGNALRERRQVPEAIALLLQALILAEGGRDTEGPRWRILMELGDAYRDIGDVGNAEQTLQSGIAAARAAAEPADLAGLFNSLGTVFLKQRESARAIEVFKSSLAELERQGDIFRPAQVQNNLALAHSEQRDWVAAESAFAASLELKRRAGDLLGQGLALQNLSRVQAAQGRLKEAIVSCDEAVRIFAAQAHHRRMGVAKHTLSKYLRKLGDLERAGTVLEEAVSLLQQAGDTTAAEAARSDLHALKKRAGLPWWAWVAIALSAILLLFSLFAFMALS